MAHPETPEAVDAPLTEDSAAAALSKLFQQDAAPEEQDEEPETDAEVDDGNDLELDDGDEEGEADEPETAIDPPASLNAEEKKAFAQLPTEAQQLIADVETRRNQQVQEATTKAANREREAQSAVAQADARAKAVYAAQLEQIGNAFVPEEPQRAWYGDDVSYLTACRQYDQQVAQHGAFMQQIADMKIEAANQVSEAFVQQRDQELLATVPEFANADTREAWAGKVLGIGRELGFDDAELNSLNATGFKALDQIAEWKVKAEKLDKAVSRQMQKVRAGKGKPLRPSAAQREGSGNRAFSEASARLKSSGSVDDAAAALRALL